MYYFSIYDKYNYCHSIDNCVLNYYLYISVESAIEILHNLGSCRNTYWERLNCSSCAKWSFYQNHIHFDDGMYIKVGHYTEYDKTKKKFHLLPMLCLEVNPNKHYEKESFKEILSFLKEYCNSGTLIRYDYAIDIPLDISKVKIFNTRKEKGLYKGTFYYGQRNTHGFCKIYDKGKESGLDSSLTRVEHTLVYNKKPSAGVYYTQRDGNIYAITERFPSKATVFPEIDYKEGLNVSLLGSDCAVIAENADGKLSLKADICSPEDVACEHLYVFKIN